MISEAQTYLRDLNRNKADISEMATLKQPNKKPNKKLDDKFFRY